MNGAALLFINEDLQSVYRLGHVSFPLAVDPFFQTPFPYLLQILNTMEPDYTGIAAQRVTRKIRTFIT